VNVSEGRDPAVLGALAAAAGDALLDLHSDPDHNRAVLTLGGPATEAAVRDVAVAALERIDLSVHGGAHPRLGALDVVPFVPLDGGGSPVGAGAALDEAVVARDRFAAWAGDTLDLPCFLYGPERTLPEVRRHAFDGLAPDTGPSRPRPRSGACAVGARPALVAYNLWLARADVALARRIAAAVRGPAVRALGLDVGGRPQVSCNLLDPFVTGPADVYDAVAGLAQEAGGAVEGAELVGLVPAAVVAGIPVGRLAELDLDEDRTVEARLGRGRG